MREKVLVYRSSVSFQTFSMKYNQMALGHLTACLNYFKLFIKIHEVLYGKEQLSLYDVFNYEDLSEVIDDCNENVVGVYKEKYKKVLSNPLHGNLHKHLDVIMEFFITLYIRVCIETSDLKVYSNIKYEFEEDFFKLVSNITSNLLPINALQDHIDMCELFEFAPEETVIDDRKRYEKVKFLNDIDIIHTVVNKEESKDVLDTINILYLTLNETNHIKREIHVFIDTFLEAYISRSSIFKKVIEATITVLNYVKSVLATISAINLDESINNFIRVLFVEEIVPSQESTEKCFTAINDANNHMLQNTEKYKDPKFDKVRGCLHLGTLFMKTCKYEMVVDHMKEIFDETQHQVYFYADELSNKLYEVPMAFLALTCGSDDDKLELLLEDVPKIVDNIKNLEKAIGSGIKKSFNNKLKIRKH